MERRQVRSKEKKEYREARRVEKGHIRRAKEKNVEKMGG